MKTILVPVCGLCLLGALAYQAPSQAQGVCYYVTPDGRMVNLDDICQSDSAPSPQSTSSQSASGMSDLGSNTASQAAPTAPQVTRTTITINGTSPADTEAAPTVIETPMTSPSQPATTFISGPGQPINGGAVMTDSDPRIIRQPATTPLGTPYPGAPATEMTAPDAASSSVEPSETASPEMTSP